MSNKKRLILSVLGVFLGTIPLIITAYLAEYALVSPYLAFVLTIVSVGILLVAIIFAAKVDYSTGKYVCRKCGYEFKPDFKAYIFATHTLTTRNLKCPHCGEKSFCKRVMIN